jgi:hypothetical protein
MFNFFRNLHKRTKLIRPADNRPMQCLSQQLEEHRPQDLRPRLLRRVRGKANRSTLKKVPALWEAIWKGRLHAHYAVVYYSCGWALCRLRTVWLSGK